MKRNHEKKEKNTREKNQSSLITKESVSAVCAMFSLLALIILCTRTLIFGDLGYAVFTLLTGVFGYFAYPVLLGCFYLSVTSLLEKRFIKNRKAVLCVVLCGTFAAFVLQTALTWRWFENAGYAAQCYYAAETTFGATLTGWLGGLIIGFFATITSKIGAIIAFSVLSVLFGYAAWTAVKKKGGKTENARANKVENANAFAPVEIQTYENAAQTISSQTISAQPVMEQASLGAQTQTPAFEKVENNYQDLGFDMQMQQRPMVNLQERENTSGQAQNNNAFSPFGNPQTMRTDLSGSTPRENREILFSATPAENYQKNLIFDPNSRVNRRPSVGLSEQTPVQSGYTPSYTAEYQKTVNENAQTGAPLKIVQDQVDEYALRDYGAQETNDPYSLNIPRMQTVEEPPVLPQEPVSYPKFEEEQSFEREEVSTRENAETARFEREGREDRTDRDLGWNDYKELFSAENPNVFGDREEDRRVADEAFPSRRGAREETFEQSDRGENNVLDEIIGNNRSQGTPLDSGRSSERLGRDFFGEEEEEKDDPYTLKDDFANSRGSSFETVSRRGEERLSETISSPVSPVVEPVQEQKPPVVKEPEPPKPRVIRPYVRVPLDDFDCRDIEPTANMQEIAETKENIISTLEEFNVNGTTISSVAHGPTVTRYNVALPRNILPKKVVALDQSIAMSLHSSGINIYPNYEDGAVSIEVPNKERQFVQLGCMLTGDTFVNSKPSSLMFAMGKDVGNRKVYGDISKMIHMLVAGSSGSGKSVFLGSLIISLIYKYSPEELRLILIDPKKTEFVLYHDLPHLMINEIITDVHKAVQSLNWAIGEMNRRYGLFEHMSRSGTYVVNLDDYNANVAKKEDKLPKIVIIIDELADLMLAAKKEIEDRIQNLTQKARAAGIHLIVATQRPSTDVITGVIKSNLATRIAFGVATDVDSRVILDQSGAQNLLGKGDFLYTMQGINTPVRVQSAFISSTDSQRVVNFIKANNEAYYDAEATAYINNTRSESGGDGLSGGGDEVEGVYIEALKFVILSGSASISMIQRKCSVGYNKAGKIVEWMEDMGYISSFDGAKARKVLITKEEFESKYGPI